MARDPNGSARSGTAPTASSLAVAAKRLRPTVVRVKAGLGALEALSIWGRCPEGKRAETDAERVDMASLQIEPPRHFRFEDMDHSCSRGWEKVRGS